MILNERNQKAARQGLLFIAYGSLVDQIFCRLFQL